MKIKHLLLFICTFLTFRAFADDPFIELLKKKLLVPYSNYFEKKRERVYLHVNRSEYLAGDNIWFKAYVFNPGNRLPFNETNKLYVELFDPKGKLIERKTLYVHEGCTNGLFRIDEALITGNYTIRAYTNWMRNFSDQPFYSQTVSITAVEAQKPPSGLPEQASGDLDVQFFAEGGTSIRETDTHFGVKVTLPDGHGAQTFGYLLGPKGDTLQTFQTNNLGIGEFTLYNVPNEDYKVRVNYKGQTKELTLPEPQEKGLALYVNNMHPHTVFAQIKTNELTLAQFNKQPFYVLVHNNGNVYGSLILELDKKETMLSINKDSMGPGVNYITLFSSKFEPIAERLVYNSNRSIKGSLSLSHRLVNDSLTVEVSSTDTSGKVSAANLSFSILPQQTVGNKFNSSLLADVLLNSAVKGPVETPNYYFEATDYQHQKDLDNLLLTQGWRKYEWSDILNDKVPASPHEFEVGFTITGRAQNRWNDKAAIESQVTLFSPDNNLLLSQKPDEDGKISFKNLYLIDSSRVILSATTFKGGTWNRNLKANIIYHNFDSTITVNSFNTGLPVIPTGIKSTKLLKERLFELKEVVVVARKKEPFEGNPYRTMEDRIFEITKENFTYYSSIDQLLMAEFALPVSRNRDGNLEINMGRGSQGNPVLIVDGFQESLSYLDFLLLQDIEAIAVTPFNPRLGLQGSNGSINIIRRQKPLDFGPKEFSSHRNFLVNGYAKPTAFYTPKYALPPESETYQQLATLFWKPDVKTDSTGKAQFKFAIPKEIKNVIIRAEGMAPNGTVYFENKTLALSPGS